MYSKLLGSSIALVLLGGLTGCDMAKDWLEKKGNEALREEMEKDAKKKASTDDEDDEKKANSDAPSGPVWKTASGDAVALERVDLTQGSMAGMTILAPKGVKVTATLGGRGADVNEFNHGFSVWVREDPTATLELMKEAAKVLHMDAKLESEDKNSFVVQSKSLDGNAIYHYYGFFPAGGKKYVCQTQTSSEGDKANAEQIDKLCESLELNGKAIGTAPAAEEKPADKPAEDPSASKASEPSTDKTPATIPAKAEAPAKAEPTKPAAAPAPAEPAKTAAAPAPAPATPAAAPAPAKNGLTMPGKRAKKKS